MTGNRYSPDTHDAQVEAFLAHVRAEAARVGLSLESLVERLLPQLRALHEQANRDRGGLEP